MGGEFATGEFCFLGKYGDLGGDLRPLILNKFATHGRCWSVLILLRSSLSSLHLFGVFAQAFRAWRAHQGKGVFA
jgi:hypothetical protein